MHLLLCQMYILRHTHLRLWHTSPSLRLQWFSALHPNNNPPSSASTMHLFVTNDQHTCVVPFTIHLRPFHFVIGLHTHLPDLQISPIIMLQSLDVSQRLFLALPIKHYNNVTRDCFYTTSLPINLHVSSVQAWEGLHRQRPTRQTSPLLESHSESEVHGFINAPPVSMHILSTSLIVCNGFLFC